MKTFKTLIVEDNELNIKYLRLLFDKWKMDYSVARNGEEAIQMSENELFSLILMDIHMPYKNGFEATLEIRNNPYNVNQKTPIIAVSADCVTEQMNRAYEIGMNDFLSKPFIPEDIFNLIQKNELDQK